MNILNILILHVKVVRGFVIIAHYNIISVQIVLVINHLDQVIL